MNQLKYEAAGKVFNGLNYQTRPSNDSIKGANSAEDKPAAKYWWDIYDATLTGDFKQLLEFHKINNPVIEDGEEVKTINGKVENKTSFTRITVTADEVERVRPVIQGI